MTSSHTSSKIYFFDHDSLLFRHLFSAGPSSFLYPYSVSKHASALVAVVTNEVMATSSFTMSQVGGDASSSVANKPFSFSGIYNVVNIQTLNGTSNGVVPAGDFISLTKSLTFQPDQRLHTVAINILNDDLPEEDESFKVGKFFCLFCSIGLQDHKFLTGCTFIQDYTDSLRRESRDH